MKKILLSLYRYLCFFLLMAFLITCCMLLFLSTMSSSMGIELTEQDINKAAILTFGNVVFLSLICTLTDAARRKFTVDRHVKKIVAAAERIAKGDYSVRIAPIHGFDRADGLDRVAECFNEMARELASVETLQSDFISNVSHEIKTPLSVVQNYGTLLQQSELSEEERLRYAKSVSEACRRLSGLITNILKLNKLENKQIFPAPHKYDLGEQICECLLTFENVWEEKSIDIETDIAEDVEINADPELLMLVWNNLFSNAFKFTESGGTVSVSLGSDEEYICVSVSDSGCGISPEVGRRIFDKFYQCDTSRSTEGNGLGLALVRRVVDIVDGEISVTSELGRGSVFTVKLRRDKNG